MSAKTLPFQYRGGWSGQQTWSDAEDRWVRVAVKGARRVEQGARTYEQLLDALDRIDGRPVMRDYINGLQAGLSQEEASKPLPFGPDGEPLPAGAAPEPDPVEEGDPETLISGPMGIGQVALVDVWWVRHMREDLVDPDDIRSRVNELARVELLDYLDRRNPDPKSFWGSSSQIPPKAHATWSGLWSLHNQARLQDLEAIKDKLAPYPAVYEWFHQVFQKGAEQYAAEAGQKGMAAARDLLAPPAPAPGVWIQQPLFDFLEAM